MPRVTLGDWQGAPGQLPPGVKVYVIGDIHGRADLLAAILEAVRAEVMSTGPGTRQTLVLIGDYVDRGPCSRAVVETLVNLDILGLECRYLCGNHEAFMLEFLDSPLSAMSWLFCGGAQTMRSYDVDPPGFPAFFDRSVIDGAASALSSHIPGTHKAFLSSLLPRWQIGGYHFVHAGVRPGVPLAKQVEKDLFWIDAAFLKSDADHGAVIVHGHSVTEEPQIRHNRIGIDTGAYASGRLTCLILDGRRLRFAVTRED